MTGCLIQQLTSSGNQQYIFFLIYYFIFQLQDKLSTRPSTLTIGGASPPLPRKKMPETAVLRRLPLPHYGVEIKLLHSGGSVKQTALGEGRHPRAAARRLGFAAAGADRHIAESAAGGPVALAAFAEVSRLINVVIVEITEFSLHAFASGALNDLFRLVFGCWIGFVDGIVIL